MLTPPDSLKVLLLLLLLLEALAAAGFLGASFLGLGASFLGGAAFLASFFFLPALVSGAEVEASLRASA